MSLRSPLAIVLLLIAPAVRAQDTPAPSSLLGRVDGTTYFSPTGAYHLTIPILAGYGSDITDTRYLATFRDDFTYISIAVVPQDATDRWEMDTEDRDTYLQKYFGKYVLSSFLREFSSAHYEPNALFNAKAFGGTLITFVTVPGGSMFASEIAAFSNPSNPPVAKRGNMLFVNSGDVYVISMELGGRVVEGRASHLTSDQEDALLRERLYGVADRIVFTSPPPAPQ